MPGSWKIGGWRWLWGILAGVTVISVWSQQPQSTVVNPPGTRLTLSTADAGPFRQMQMIRGTVEFERPQPAAGEEDPAWHLFGYLLDPPIPAGSMRCGTLVYPCSYNPGVQFGQHIFWGRGNPAPKNPWPMRITDKLPPLPPGSYRIAAVVERERTVLAFANGNPVLHPRTVVISNWLPLTILPADDAWVQGMIDQLEASLEPPAPEDGEEGHAAWLDKLHQLQLLDHPAVWQLLSVPFRNGLQIPYENMLSTRQPVRACAWLRGRLDDPRQRVDSSYLRTMLAICGRAELPPAPELEPSENPTVSVEYQEAFTRSAEQWMEWTRRQIDVEGARLLASLEKREARNRSDAIGALLGWVPTEQPLWRAAQAQAASQSPSAIARQLGGGYFQPIGEAWPFTPVWAGRLRGEVLRLLTPLDPIARAMLLQRLSSIFGDGEWAGAYEEELRQPHLHSNPGAARELIDSLANLAPERAAAIVRSELGKPQTWLTPDMLDLLPSDPRPFTDDELVQWLEEHPSFRGGSNLWEMAVARYASAAVAPRIREVFEQRRPHCQPALLGYLVRTDPEYAASILDTARSPQSGLPPCLEDWLRGSPQFGMGPVLEEFLAAHLFHSEFVLREAAAINLSLYGGTAAETHLREAIRRFRRQWGGRAEDLGKSASDSSYEATLARALTTARAWTLAPEQLADLRTLCVGKPCEQLVKSMEDLWARPLFVHATRARGKWHGNVAQYAFDSEAGLRARLQTLPPGTAIQVNATGPDFQAMRETIRSTAVSAGLKVVD